MCPQRKSRIHRSCARLCATSRHSPSGTCLTPIKHSSLKQNVCQLCPLTRTTSSTLSAQLRVSISRRCLRSLILKNITADFTPTIMHDIIATAAVPQHRARHRSARFLGSPRPITQPQVTEDTREVGSPQCPWKETGSLKSRPQCQSLCHLSTLEKKTEKIW